MAEPQAVHAQLRADRDRFVGFAFATAHLLLETDLEGRILFAAGANCGLAASGVSGLNGRLLSDLVDPAEREFFGHVLRRVSDRAATHLIRTRFVTAAGPKVDLLIGGRRLDLPSGSRLFFGLILANGFDGGPATTGYDRMEDFTKAATERLSVAQSTGSQENLTLFVVDELARAASSIEPDQLKALMAKIQTYLRSVSVTGHMVGTMAPGKFGLVRAPGVTDEEIRRNVTRLLSEAGVNSTVQAFDLPFDTKGLSDTDAARALAFSIRRFAEASAQDFDLHSLKDGAAAILSETLTTMASARKVMETGKIDVVYQPIVALNTGEVHHLEALSRVSGVSSIATWIRFIEETGLVQDFDLTLASKVLETLREQKRVGWRQKVAINLSARSLLSKIFRGQFETLMDNHLDVAPQVMIELTETAAVTDFKAMAGILGELRKRGHQVCLDDVGAGDTSFETLRTLPCDYIKIDGAIIRSALESREERGMLQALATLARQKNAEIIAEQIETEDQARLVQDIGADFGQGFLYGPPSTEGIAFKPREKKGYDPQWAPIKKRPI